MDLREEINKYLENHIDEIEIARTRPNFSWMDVAYDIDCELDNGTPAQDAQSTRDYIRCRFKMLRKRKVKKIDLKLKAPVKVIRRLIYDIETSPNIVFSWNVGSKTYLDIENIIQERAIICISWKWEHESVVHSLSWNNGDDRQMLENFAKVMNSADEIVTHNGDNFDTRWVRARCMYHGIPLSAKFNSIDTLKLARKQFRLNSNKLTYIAQFLGLGKKMDTGGFKLWKDICLKNDRAALKKMVDYCNQDVILLEKVYKALKNYSPDKKFKY